MPSKTQQLKQITWVCTHQHEKKKKHTKERKNNKSKPQKEMCSLTVSVYTLTSTQGTLCKVRDATWKVLHQIHGCVCLWGKGWRMHWGGEQSIFNFIRQVEELHVKKKKKKNLKQGWQNVHNY